ncbi:MAG: tetratricopeptide repeat protein [Rhizobiaceae bacterium]|nr:tetratricopeptide repeat protein [Rhizobiaceae bacterium]
MTSNTLVEDGNVREPSPQQLAFLLELSNSQQFERASAELGQLLPQFPDSLVLLSLGVSIFGQMGRHADAETLARRAVALAPQLAPGHLNLGLVLRSMGKLDEALQCFDRAAELDPKMVMAHHHRGLIHYRAGNIQIAGAAFDRVVELQPDFASAHYYRGNLLATVGNLGEAVSAYSNAIRCNPGFAQAHNDLGTIFLRLSAIDAALTCFRSAIEHMPGLAIAHENLGIVLAAKQELPEAIAAFEQAYSLDQNASSALAQKLYAKAKICDFPEADPSIVERVGTRTSPFAMFALEDNPKRHLDRAKFHWNRRAGAIRPVPLPAAPKDRPERIRIGYFSADFHEHATLRLMSGLIREHDRSRFELFIYSYGLGKTGPLREAVVKGDLHFHDVQSAPDAAIAQLARSHQLDIAIDLKGFTSETRCELFGFRLAPIQMSFLGYPGTLGTDAMDYIIADNTVIPDEVRDCYSESVIYLPNSYQPNDSQRKAATTSTKRASVGLPNKGFVFCCFNSSYKIGLEEFEIWMRVLNKVEGSVLWLIDSNQWAKDNLRKAAEQRGVSADRLIFAPKVDYAEHLERHKHADLFLDTFNYNAHTTGSDALWMGLPLVTRPGRQFSARVGASLLNAAGLPELVANSAQEYENLILELASDPGKLSQISKKLAQARRKAPLFDTRRYTSNFEAGLQLAYNRYIAGEQPGDIIVPDKQQN